MAMPLDVVDYKLSAEWVPAVLQYLPDLFTPGLISIERNYSIPLSPLEIYPYFAVII